jgi:hypothetical protein
MFLRGFDYVDDFPWFRPNWTGTSLLLTAPILLWLVRVRSRAPLVGWLWLSVALVLVPIVTHGNVGFAQWSYRFVLDVAPLLFLMLGLLFRERISSMAKAAIVIGVLANAYGVWTTVLTEFVAY